MPKVKVGKDYVIRYDWAEIFVTWTEPKNSIIYRDPVTIGKSNGMVYFSRGNVTHRTTLKLTQSMAIYLVKEMCHCDLGAVANWLNNSTDEDIELLRMATSEFFLTA